MTSPVELNDRQLHRLADGREYRSMTMEVRAVEGGEKAQCEGILDPDVEHSIGNLSRIAISAMDSTDREIIDIMTCK